jgi:hypothetical protein
MVNGLNLARCVVINNTQCARDKRIMAMLFNNNNIMAFYFFTSKYCNAFLGLAVSKLFLKKVKISRNYLFKMLNFKKITRDSKI